MAADASPRTAAVASVPHGTKALPNAMPDLTLTEGQADGRFTIHVGDRVTLRLAENASTGYRWNVAELDRSVLDTETAAFQPGADRPGSGGSASWVFRARKAGSTRLELIKSRKWEGHKDSDQRFSVHITVEAS